MSKIISYIFEAIDAFSGVAVKIGKSVESIDKKVMQVNERLKKSAESMKKVGESMSLYLTLPTVAFGVASLKAYNDHEQALAQVQTALKSTGARAGFTAQQLSMMAESLETHSLFDHSQILTQVTSQLLRFGNVSGTTFKRAQQDAADWAARQHISLQMASLALGRALQDPERGTMMLRRAGIMFTKTQQQVIDTLVKTGRTAIAQDYILRRFEKSFGGAAQAAADAGIGPLIVLQHQFKGLEEQIGEALAKAILPLIPKIQEMIDYLKNLDPATKKVILAIAGFIAIFGPLMAAIGIAGLALSGLATIFTVITAPITVTILAVAALTVAMVKLFNIVKKFRGVKPGWGPFGMIGETKLPSDGQATPGQPFSWSHLLHSPWAAMPAQGAMPAKSTVDVNVNVNAPAQIVKDVQAQSNSNHVNVNVGRNMGHI